MRYLLSYFFLLFNIVFVTAQNTGHNKCSQKTKYLNHTAVSMSSRLINIDKYDVNYYKLDLHVERDTLFIEGNVTIKATVASSALDTFICELHSDHIVDSIYYNGQKKAYIHASDLISIPIGSTLNQGSKMEVVVYYSGVAPSSASSAIGQGFSTRSSPSWGNEATWSLSQPYSAYEWFPVKQELQDKADSVEVWITTDNANKAGSNGVLMNVTPMPNNKARYEWKSNYPIAYYLISVAVAKYVDYTIYAKPQGYPDSIPVVNYIYDNPGTLPQFQSEIDKTVDMLEVFSDKFGIYPFHKEKYGHCMAPFSGGMEHQTMTSQGFFFTDLTSHELAHQWFGDDVTCASWTDIFLNEGFASYLEYIYVEEKEASRARSWLDNTHNGALQTTGSVFVDDTTNVGRIFSSSLTYDKGAFLLHMLRYEINNDSIFFKALKTYQNTYSGGNATAKQFKSIVEQISGMDFTDFFDQWFYGQGYPIFNVSYALANNNLYLEVEQIVTAPFATDLFKTHFDLNVRIAQTNLLDTTFRLYMDDYTQRYTIENISGVFVSAEVDPDQWLLNGVGVVTEDPILSVKELASTEIKVFPNPFDDEVNIELSEVQNDLVYQVYDLNGRRVKEGFMNSGNKIKFSMNGEVSGSYLLRVQYANGETEEFNLIKK